MSKKENGNQAKFLHVVENITIAVEQNEPTTDKNGQIKLLNIKPEFQPLAEFFANKFDAQQTMNANLSTQVGRLSNTVANLASKIDDKVVHDKEPDLVISPFADPDRADVAYVDSPLPAEAWYPCSTSDLAVLVDLTASRLGFLFRKAGIQGNPKYHYASKIGKTSFTQRYRATALRELLDVARAGKIVGLKSYELDKLEKYFRLHQLLN